MRDIVENVLETPVYHTLLSLLFYCMSAKDLDTAPMTAGLPSEEYESVSSKLYRHCILAATRRSVNPQLNSA